MTEAFPDSDRPPEPPIGSLRQIMELSGACAQVWELGFMIRAMPTTRRVMAQQLLEQDPYSAEQRVRTGIVSGLLMDRIVASLGEISGIVSEERRLGRALVAGQSMSGRQFTFGDVTYLSATTMIYGGVSPDVLIEPDEAMRRDTERDMLFAAPAVCNAFNGAIATMSLPLQRRQNSARYSGGALPYRKRPQSGF